MNSLNYSCKVLLIKVNMKYIDLFKKQIVCQCTGLYDVCGCTGLYDAFMMYDVVKICNRFRVATLLSLFLYLVLMYILDPSQ